MSKKLGDISFITKLAGFEHTEYIQDSCSHTKVNEDDVPLFIGRTIRDGKIDTHFDWYIPLKLSQLLERSQLRKKCLVLPYVGTLGDLAIFDGHYAAHLGSNVAKIELNDNCGYSEEFIYYFLKSPYGQKLLLRDMQGGLQKNITMGAIRDVELPDLSVDDQKCITNVLSLIDHQIENNNAICAELEAMAKLLYDYWFVQFDFPDENGKPYKSSGGKMVWSEELKREIPEGWNAGNLYNIADFINGLACQKFRPEVGGESLPVIKIGEMHDGITEKTERVRADIPPKNIIHDGDILFSWSATLEAMIWTGDVGGLNQHIFKVVPKLCSKHYVYQQLSAYILNFVKMADARKTTMGHITTDHLKQSKIALPPNNIVALYEEKVESIYSMILTCRQENRSLASLRDFLLPLLMNGQVTFKEADCH